jgi:hypothetical protein
MALTSDHWIGTASADWGASSADWSAGFPTSDDNVVISTASVLTVSYSGSDSFTVHSLTAGRDLFDMSGGSLAITTTASFADGFTQTGGVFSAGGKIMVKGAGSLTGGSAEGKTDFVSDGSVALANYTLGGDSALTNFGTTDLTAGITLGDANGTGAKIDNEKGGVFDIEGDFGIALGAQTAEFINAGTLEKTAGTGLSVIAVDVVDTGKIVVLAAGTTLDLAGPSNNLAAAISGAGTFELGGFGNSSNDVIDRATTITTAAFTIDYPQTLVSLGENLGYAGTFTMGEGVTLDFAGFVLTLAGTNSLFWVIEGPGTLVTTKGSTTSDNELFVGGGVLWQNWGTVSETTVALQLGDTTDNPATLINEKGGKYLFAGDFGINIGNALNSTFINAAGAILEKTAGTGLSVIAVDVVDTGKIVVAAAGTTLDLAGPSNSLAGAISGAGTFVLGGFGSGANYLIGKGTTITTKDFTIAYAQTVVTLGENLGYAGTFTMENQGTLDLDGFGLTLSKTATFADCLAEDQGTLVTTHGTTASLSSLVYLDFGADWQNSGVVDAVGALVIGGDGFTNDTFTNEKGGVFDFGSGGAIGIGGVSSSRFVNSAGAVFEKTAGTDDGIVAVAFTNDGTVKVETGTIEFQNAVVGNGSFSIAAGAALQFDSTVAAGSGVDFAGRGGGELVLEDGDKFAAGIHGFGGSDEIALTNVAFGGSGFKLSYHGNAKEGVLTVTDGTDTARQTFFGDYKTADFHASADPSGGTLITDPTTHAFFASAR